MHSGLEPTAIFEDISSGIFQDRMVKVEVTYQVVQHHAASIPTHGTAT